MKRARTMITTMVIHVHLGRHGAAINML